MAVTEKEFLNFSQSKPVSEEFDIRNKISRGYYGAYHSCSLFFDSNTEIINNKGHAEFIESLKRSEDEFIKIIGNKLFFLKKQRENCDYKLNYEVKSSTLTMVLLEIERLFQRIEKIK